MAICGFLGMKNTPLGILASTSHTHINRLHRIVGYTTVFLVAIHAAFYTVHFARNGKLQSLLKVEDLAGIGAGISMLTLLMGYFRNRHYEVFYASHIAGFVFALLLTGLHRPDWAKKLPIVMSLIGYLWAIDRLIRASRLTYNLINNQVTMYPLPGGASRLFLRKPSLKFARPGSHCFLWIPQISIYQTHPFTIVSNDHDGLELVMKRCDGFTKRVYDLALQNPGRVARVSIDGPYGSLPDTTVYDKLILVAGGSGGAFTFGFMNYYFSCPKRTLVQSIDFIWAVKSTGMLMFR
jgi:predicted ferric reductase